MNKYDVVVIGGGSGGLNVAAGAANFGVDVALIEKEKLGGDCLHYGCVPSKALIKSAEAAYHASNGEIYGIESELKNVDFSKVSNRIKDVISKIEEHDSPERFEEMGVEVLFGEPSFVSNGILELNGERIEADKFVIATGSKPSVPPIDGLDEIDYLTNLNVFDLDGLPERLAVIGGGPIGSEMSQGFSRLGSDVTVFEGADHVLSREDEEVAEELMKVFESEGVTVHTNSQVTRVKENEKSITVIAETEDGEEIREYVDKVLVATGQRPNTEGLNLEAAGVELKERGGIKVDSKMRTTAKDVYACGDVVGPYQFTHIAEYQAKTIVWNLFFPFKKKVDYSAVPWTTFTDPELARVGLSPDEGREQGHDVYTLKGEEVDRFRTGGYEHGMVKLVVDDSGSIKGVTMLLPNAGEVIHEFILAMEQGIKASDISQMIHVYPTMAQANKKVVNEFMREKYLTPFTKKVARFFFNISR